MFIKIKVRAGAKKEEIKQTGQDHFEISVKEEAERNMANTRIMEIIAEEYGISANKIRMISGHQRPNKILEIRD
jgi:hypothetical protein